MKRYGGVIFDLDGTLLDTLEDLTDSMNDILEQYGLARKSLEEMAAYLGNGSAAYLKQAAGEALEPTQFAECLAQYQAHYQVCMQRHTKPFLGICEMLQDLKQQGIRTAVVSNKFDAAVKTLCEQFFGDGLDVMLGEGNGLRPKPAGDMLQAAAQQMQIPLSECVYVGDTEVDLATAKAAEMDCICVTWGFRTKEQLLQCGAETIVETVEALRQALLQDEEALQIHLLPQHFSICQIPDVSEGKRQGEIYFVAKTDQECSLVCETAYVPSYTLAREDGWRAFRIEAMLDFSLIGILARISALLAEQKIGIFAISTYRTDYILTKAEQMPRALETLRQAGYWLE